MFKSSKWVLQVIFIVFLLYSCNHKTTVNQLFITINDGKFYKNNQQYYFIGANYWYGALIAADTTCGNRIRLARELDFMKSNGIDNLRILVGAEGPDNQPFRVTPTLVGQNTTLNQTLLTGLDYLITELGKRQMYAVLYFTNNWEWSGGFAQYLNWNGYGEYPNPNIDKYSWWDFFLYQKQFYNCKPCVKQVNNYITQIITRTNSISGIKYTNEPAIMAWQLANEPRPMFTDNFQSYYNWVKSTSELIRRYDKNHLITIGNEGQMGCNDSINFFTKIHDLPNIDYLTIHIWVKNWQWYDYTNPQSTFEPAIQKAANYIDNHLAVAKKLNKPMVIEEFGIARDNELYTAGSPVTYRDKYFDYIFNRVYQSSKTKNNIAGCNFWVFGGLYQPVAGKKFWQPGDPFTGDPPQEPHGLNSVFMSDTSTIDLIKKYNNLINK